MIDDAAHWPNTEATSPPDLQTGATIFAMATGAGRASIAVMRLSGPGSGDALRKLAISVPPPRRASLRRLRDANGRTLDVALVLWLPGPGSPTGEDCAELHLHAGPAVIEGVAVALVGAGARPAEAGEFSRRAFLNGRIDLTAAEAVADLVAAETEAQRSQALRQMDGALGRQFDNWTTRLRRELARQEARIDFPDEAGHPAGEETELRGLIAEIEAQLDDAPNAERLRQGLTFVVSGAPNVGKSSLVNALVGRDVAIVSALPGTTRDVIEVRTVFGGVPVTLIDTAGLCSSEDPVEQEGVRRARLQADRADLVLAVSEAGSPSAVCSAICTVYIDNKIDQAAASAGRLGVSVVSGAGLADLRQLLDDAARRLTRGAGPAPLTRARHRAACSLAARHLRAALKAGAEEFRAEELRLAMMNLGRVTGRVGVEGVLDDVFSQFCIGK